MYGSTFARTSPGRKPSRSPASTAGRADDRVDGAGADLLPALDELDELLDDRLSLRDLDVVAAQREAVTAQIDGAAEPLPQGVEYPVADACKLSGDVVRNVENRLH